MTGASALGGPVTGAPALVEPLTGASALVELVQVVRRFGGPTTEPVLRGVDLRIDAGEYLAVTGPSGAGKSTVLGILGLLDRPSAGEYLFEGAPTSAMPDRARSALRGTGIGFVFQAFHLIAHRSVLDNVRLAFTYGEVPRGEREARAAAALERVGLGHRLRARPTTLSGGERQRVAVARAVCRQPRLLLADEPTGNLDRRNTETVLDLFDQLNAEGLTTVVITHDDEVAARAARQVRVAEGVVTEVRAPAQAPAHAPGRGR